MILQPLKLCRRIQMVKDDIVVAGCARPETTPCNLDHFYKMLYLSRLVDTSATKVIKLCPSIDMQMIRQIDRYL